MDDKHKACEDCGRNHSKDLDDHVDLASAMAKDFTEDVFPELWKMAKVNLKELKKKELAQEMFLTGAAQMLTAFLERMKEFDGKDKFSEDDFLAS